MRISIKYALIAGVIFGLLLPFFVLYGQKAIIPVLMFILLVTIAAMILFYYKQNSLIYIPGTFKIISAPWGEFKSPS